MNQFSWAQVNIKTKKVRFYETSEWETIFSFANITQNDEPVHNIMRYTAFINTAEFGNVDFGRYFGLVFGLGNHNIGFIHSTDSIKKKQRAYSLYVPVFFKVGNLKKRVYFYAGGQYDFLYNYKEKTFVNGRKTDVFNEWFGSRTSKFLPSVFAGAQLPLGFNVKFTYMWNNFMNSDFSETVNGITTRPYEGMKANIFYFSLSLHIPSRPEKTNQVNYSQRPERSAK